MTTLPFRTTVIALAIAQAFFLVPSSDAQTAQQAMPEVVVSVSRPSAERADTSSIAGFGELPLLETPMSVTVFTRKELQDLQIRSTTELARFDASISDAYNAVGYAEQFSIRGFALSNANSYRKDGLVISGDASIPLENKERVEVLKGLAGVQVGVAVPGGVLNYVTKRPTADPLRSVTLGASERGTLYSSLDLGGKFDDPRFGYRFNVAAEKLRSYVKGADGERYLAAGAFDWQITPRALLQLDLDYHYKSQLTQPGFQLINGTDLPVGVNAGAMLNDQPWSKPVTSRTGNIGLRFAYQFENEWRLAMAANRHYFKRDDFAAFPYGCSTDGLYPGYCANGDFDVYDYQSTGERKPVLTSQVLMQGKLRSGATVHDISAGFSTLSSRDHHGDYVYGTADFLNNGISNFYRSVAVAPTTDISTSNIVLRQRNEERSVFVQDIVGLTPTLKLHAGLRYTEVKRVSFEDGYGLKQNSLLPNLALVSTPREGLAFYASYAEGLEPGGVPPLGTSNHNQQLAPNESRQFEVGVKADLNTNWRMAAALFNIRKPLELTIAGPNLPDGTPTELLARRGDAVHRGLELSADGKLTPELSLKASIAALDTNQQGTGFANLDGKRVINVPAFKSTVYLDYLVRVVPGLSLNTSWQHASNKAFNDTNSVMAPGYDVLNLGARYVMKVAGMATTVRFNVDNVADKFYWRDVTQSLGGYLFPGAPRTYKVSAQFDF